MWIIGWMLMFMGMMLLVGEYLCVEVAWRCLGYNTAYVTFGFLMLGTGVIASLIGAIDD